MPKSLGWVIAWPTRNSASRNLAKAMRLGDFAGHQEAEFFETAAIGRQFPD